ncbi:tripartite tricarboxylate transporter TctB family protein [Salinicola aestuarinus]|uniref:tripartite tricarboxylate transporter TctB family protein n=1 Tax=Salinicola aestuarinus TaxID=1949082 RepID=UPI000DA20EC1|nr:tripartite tricarboxylate transporter TctB family protein [Salinicola aestuarinus]
MSSYSQEMIFSFLLVVLSLALGAMATQIGGGANGSIAPSTFPSVIAFVMAGLSLINALKCGWCLVKERESPHARIEGVAALGVIGFLVIATLYVVGIAFVGFEISTLAFLFVTTLYLQLLRVHSRQRLTAKKVMTGLVFAVVASLSIYLVFVEFLSVRF